MPRLEPFAGIRYDPSKVDLADVVAPPYDVIGPEEQATLEARSAYNAVRVELARDEAGEQRYALARRRIDSWLSEGVLAKDPAPGFYVYRMGYRDEAGRPRQTTGVLGILGLDGDGDEGGVLPHERTMAKPKHDRLNLLRATQTNLSPIWGLSLSRGLSALCDVAGPPIARCTDDQGVHHRLWRVTEPGLVDAIKATVGAAPVVIADGHHRYATALAYRDERRAEVGPEPADHDFVLAYIVELTPEEISVGAIHRVVDGLPDDFDPLGALDGFSAQSDNLSVASIAGAGLPALVTSEGTWVLHSDDDSQGDDPDAARLGAVLDGWPAHSVTYMHSPDDVVAAITKGEGQVGLLLRPPTVAQIAATARAGRRMPEKTTFFWPKPLTGLVFRRLDT
ncbi:MAG: DUF1015 domain-containing protein [Actinomycetota bacterium]|nr:DUF1015 domain-containing protein [Actinomycetota bacterium]